MIASSILQSFNQFRARVAISEGDQYLTYDDLEQQAVALAAHLIGKGKENNRCIAIDIPNISKHIVAIVGVLLSGNHYLSLTAENRIFVDQDTTFHYSEVVTEAMLAEAMDPEAPVIYFLPPLAVDKLLCAFFTSGSTGKSKLVKHTVGNIYSDTIRQIQDNEITKEDKIDLLFSLSFSASLACIFPALMSGAELAIFDIKKEGLLRLAEFWDLKRITFSTLSVSSFHGVCKANSTLKHVNALRFISISAEPVKETTISMFQSRFPENTVLQIAYAATETRTISELKVYNDGRENLFTNSIGRVVSGKEVKIDVEIMVRWEGEDDWFSTGDLGYFNEEGYLFYLGRSATENKLNGVKINFSAIEESVEDLAEIIKVAVVVNTLNEDSSKLVCFYQGNFKEIEIRELIEAKFPANHWPQFYVKMQEIPLTHTGKIDRRILEQCDVNRSASNGLKREITTSNRIQIIINCFKAALETKNVDADTDFFQAGGDSLAALICAADIEKQLKLTLSTFAFINHSSPRKLSDYLLTAHVDDSLIEVIELNGFQVNRNNLYFLHNLPDRVYDPLINSALSETFNLKLLYYDIKSEQSDKVALIMQQIENIISHHQEVILVGYSFSGYLAHQLAALHKQVTHCVLIDTYHYFEREKYKRKLDIVSRMKSLHWHVVKNRDILYPLFLLTEKYNWIKEKKKVWKDEQFFAGVESMLAELKEDKAEAICIFFQASRRDKDYGRGWQSNFGREFNFESFNVTHHTIIQDCSNDMVKHMLGKII
ncbi:MAG: AMP-binding protein [Bacteroidota bacterium]